MRKRIFLILIFMSLGLLTACALRVNTDTRSGREGMMFIDSFGSSVIIKEGASAAAASGSLARIWLLAGGALLCATDDAFDEHFEMPDGVMNIGKLHQINLELLISARPDFVILSAELDSQVSVKASLDEAGIPSLSLTVNSFEEYQSALKMFTDITGREDLYKENGLDLLSEIDAIKKAAYGRPAPRVLLLRANSARAAARGSDTMTGIMLKDLGAVNIADSGNGLLDDLSMEVIIAEDPDFIFAVFQGDSDEKARETLESALMSNPAWSRLTAVQNGRYTVLPKDLFHQKPCERWDEAYRQLYNILYGE